MSHDDDPRNASVRIWIDGQLVPRAEAKVSVFDAGFVLGDGVWEGLRVVGGRCAFLDAHLDRLYEAAKALFIDIGMTRAQLTAALHATVEANGDRQNAEEIMNLLQALNRTQGKTIIMVTHDPRAAEYASRELYLDKGKLTSDERRAVA